MSCPLKCSLLSFLSFPMYKRSVHLPFLSILRVCLGFPPWKNVWVKEKEQRCDVLRKPPVVAFLGTFPRLRAESVGWFYTYESVQIITQFDNFVTVLWFPRTTRGAFFIFFFWFSVSPFRTSQSLQKKNTTRLVIEKNNAWKNCRFQTYSQKGSNVIKLLRVIKKTWSQSFLSLHFFFCFSFLNCFWTNSRRCFLPP